LQKPTSVTARQIVPDNPSSSECDKYQPGRGRYLLPPVVLKQNTFANASPQKVPRQMISVWSDEKARRSFITCRSFFSNMAQWSIAVSYRFIQNVRAPRPGSCAKAH
ncbi:hypothetical protein CEXT_495841, partial [Caerostris extrusa]